MYSIQILFFYVFMFEHRILRQLRTDFDDLFFYLTDNPFKIKIGSLVYQDFLKNWLKSPTTRQIQMIYLFVNKQINPCECTNNRKKKDKIKLGKKHRQQIIAGKVCMSAK